MTTAAESCTNLPPPNIGGNVKSAPRVSLDGTRIMK
jgi:hypothetical protein